MNQIIENVKDDITNHPIIIILLLSVFLIVIIYVIYKYGYSNKPKMGFTYYSHDLNDMTHIFSEITNNIDDCLKICQNQPSCEGITFDTETNTCMGQDQGRLRTDSDNFYAWVKPKNKLKEKSTNDSNAGRVLSTYVKSNTISHLKSTDIPYPSFPERYSYSFWINVEDWYYNYSNWRHVFHKGTQIDKATNKGNKILNYYTWEKIVGDFPDQTIGVWLTPFQNNLRIAITTESQLPRKMVHKDGHVEKCHCLGENKKNCTRCWITDQSDDPDHYRDSQLDFKDTKNLEYFDLKDIQTNVPTHIMISLNGTFVEIYMNGILRISQVLIGKPTWNNGDLYIHNPKTYKGHLEDLRVFPSSTDMTLAKELYNLRS